MLLAALTDGTGGGVAVTSVLGAPSLTPTLSCATATAGVAQVGAEFCGLVALTTGCGSSSTSGRQDGPAQVGGNEAGAVVSATAEASPGVGTVASVHSLQPRAAVVKFGVVVASVGGGRVCCFSC